MIDDIVNKLWENVVKLLDNRCRYPISTYRLQFNRFFRFSDAAKIVPYLNELGVTDCYTSPYLKAIAGSLHGYDICNHNALNAEIGSLWDYENFVKQLQKHKMEQVFDFVPNHMSILENLWWMDVLENGPASYFAGFFDIDWSPVKDELYQKVLLPVLGDLYGKALDNGHLHLVFEKGAFSVIHNKHKLPIDPKTIALLLNNSLTTVQTILSDKHPDCMELQSIITAANNLPDRDKIDPANVTERAREKEIIKKRLMELYRKNKQISNAINKSVKVFNGIHGNSDSFKELHRLLEAQAYRLSYWRVAFDEVNYRRFFDVNELVAIRMENPLVFEESHRLVRQLLQKYWISGLRIDHIDGLFNPAEYLIRLQKSFILDLCKEIWAQDKNFTKLDWNVVQRKLIEKLEHESKFNPSNIILRPLYIVVEKILGEGENLKETWPIHGTTGYEFASILNGILVDKRNATAILGIYRWFTKVSTNLQNTIYECKDLVMRTSMSAEVNVLGHQLNAISERSHWYRDFTLHSLRDAIREIIACFPVYRTYINAENGEVDERDNAIVLNAISEAQKRNPAISASIFEFIKDTLLLRYPSDKSLEGREEQNSFVMRFQQHTGPVMAKGVEDTAFYIYNPLVSLNDVGSYPQSFGNTIQEFHHQNLQRHKRWPHSLISSSTHDSKRSEDVRARINVISEMPREWRIALTTWSRFNNKRKIQLADQSIPDRNEEYLLYQTLLGTYPIQNMDDKQNLEYLNRIKNYMLKAIREAKVHTSWVSPNTAYEEGVIKFISNILELSPSNRFLTDFVPLNKQIAYWGKFNSLSQTLLKLFSPGVPDIYQGTEIWNYSLVDPDNRRQVDFNIRLKLLAEIKKKVINNRDLTLLTQGLMNNMNDGGIKLYVIWRALNYRKDNSGLFTDGSYMPMEASGTKQEHVCAFSWCNKNKELIVIAPRFIARLTQKTITYPTGHQIWGDTLLLLPESLKGRKYRNIYTGEEIEVTSSTDSRNLHLANILASFPVAVLEALPS